MIGSFNNGRNNYRCTYPAQYAGANGVAHPRSLYLQEDVVLDRLGPWLATAFHPGNLDATVHAMANAQDNVADAQATVAAASTITSCRARLDRYRVALEAGTDPKLIQTWIAAVQAEESTAQAGCEKYPAADPLTTNQITDLVGELGDIARVIRDAGAHTSRVSTEKSGLR